MSDPIATKTAAGAGPLVRRALGLAAMAAAVAVALAVLRQLTRQIDYHAVVTALRQADHTTLLWSIAATGASFAALIGRDAGALRHVGARPPLPALLLAGFCGNALGNAVGFGTLTGGALRYRIYGAVGIGPEAVARIMVFIAVWFAVGLAATGALATLAEAPLLARVLHWPVVWLRLGALGLLVASAGAVALCRLGRIRLAGVELSLPGPGLAALQIGLTALDLVAAAAALWVLMPAGTIDFGAFAAIFVAATALGVVSHAPGGIGVFEAVVLLALHGRAPAATAAALVVYRIVYFGLPLIVSAACLALFELRLLSRRPLSPVGRALGRSAARLSPAFLGVITFMLGIMLVVSGATPTFGHRLAILSVRVPLWLVETSHFIGSLAGVLLLFVARGLFRRLDGAWLLAFVLTLGSLALSLLKGLAYTEASLLAALLVLLLATRRQFTRRASLLEQPFTLGWCVAVGLILTGGVWILFFAFRDVAYTREMWWQFEFDAQAPRALRAVVGMCVLAVILGLWSLLRVPRGRAARPGPAELARAAEIIARQPRGEALMALMGDKSLMFSQTGRSFLMFARRGRSWIALYDPVGEPDEAAELIWRFAELAAGHGGRAAFYQVRADRLPLYLDAGLKIMKLGEEARVMLQPFGLAGSARAHLRYALKRGERDGLDFAFIGPDGILAVEAELAQVSADWLSAHRAGEKSFSVAAFEPDFVRAQSAGLVRQGGRLVAFATVMTTALHREATIGLMRHVRGTSPYAMEFLFTRLLMTLKENGHEVVSLGMAPLSGLEPRPLASRWHGLAHLLWRHGGRLYNFQGLRLFKGKFGPSWEPRYLAASGTIGPYVALFDTAALAGSSPGRPS